MSSTTDQLLYDIQAAAAVNKANAEPLVFNEDEIEKELIKEAMAYKGIGIKVLSIAGGLLGTFFFLGFVFMLAHNSGIFMLVFGLISIIAAIYIDRSKGGMMLDAACIGIYLIGYVMLGFGLDNLRFNESMMSIVFLAVAVITPLFTSGFMLNFFSVLMINGCLFSLIDINKAYQLNQLLLGLVALSYTLICFNEHWLIARSPKFNIRYSAWSNGLLVSFIALLLYRAVGLGSAKYISYEWISSAMIIGIFFFVLHELIDALSIDQLRSRVLIYLVSLIVLLPAVFAPAICGALLILAVSFHIGHRTGLVAAAIALIYFVGQYYYDLQYTLLEKSMIMFVSGVLFLTAWFILKKQLKRYEQN